MSHYIQEQNGANKRQLSSSLNRNYSISYTSIPTSPIEILFRRGKVKFTSEMRISSQIKSKEQTSNFALDRPQMQQLAIS